MKTVLITGGAGYVGALLVPRLLAEDYRVRVLDLYLFGDTIFDGEKHHSRLEEFKGDLRDTSLLREASEGCDAVIHLACVSNDPSFELNPSLSRSINYEAFRPLVEISKASGVRRFIYASTSSVYGVSDAEQVTEDHPLVPITDYNKYKGLCEPILLEYQDSNFTTVIIRPATLCGYSPRMRFDLTVNILTNHAVNRGRITVYGGEQTRPNLHIQDMVDLYSMLLKLPDEKVAGKTYNAGFENYRISELAERVRKTVERELPEKKPIEVVTTPSDDVRSYRICSDKIKRELGFVPKRTVEDAVVDLIEAFRGHKFPNSLDDPRYYNIKTWQQLQTV